MSVKLLGYRKTMWKLGNNTHGSNYDFGRIFFRKKIGREPVGVRCCPARCRSEPRASLESLLWSAKRTMEVPRIEPVQNTGRTKVAGPKGKPALLLSLSISSLLSASPPSSQHPPARRAGAPAGPRLRPLRSAPAGADRGEPAARRHCGGDSGDSEGLGAMGMRLWALVAALVAALCAPAEGGGRRRAASLGEMLREVEALMEDTQHKLRNAVQEVRAGGEGSLSSRIHPPRLRSASPPRVRSAEPPARSPAPSGIAPGASRDGQRGGPRSGWSPERERDGAGRGEGELRGCLCAAGAKGAPGYPKPGFGAASVRKMRGEATCL